MWYTDSVLQDSREARYNLSVRPHVITARCFSNERHQHQKDRDSYHIIEESVLYSMLIPPTGTSEKFSAQTNRQCRKADNDNNKSIR